jgi:hypothetical protein
MRKVVPAIACLATTLIFGSGCAHTLEVKNLSRYTAAGVQPLQRRLSVNVIVSAPDSDTERLARAAASELSKYADVVQAYGPKKDVDVNASISIKPEYKGSGANFLINWPGFLVWAPAWHGYVYKANYDISILLTKGPSGEVVDSFRLPIYLDVRHADINRTWTEISWLEVSAIAFVGGIIFTRYDDTVTPILIDKIEHPIGEYVAQVIVQRLAPLAAAPPPSPPPPEVKPPPPPEAPPAAAPVPPKPEHPVPAAEPKPNETETNKPPAAPEGSSP